MIAHPRDVFRPRSALQLAKFVLMLALFLAAKGSLAVQAYWYNSYTSVTNYSPSTQPQGSIFTIVAEFSSDASTGSGCGIDGWCTYSYAPGGSYAWYDNGVPVIGQDTSDRWTDTYTCGTDREGNPVDCASERWQSTLTISTLTQGSHTIRIDFNGQCGTVYANWCFRSSTASLTVNVGPGGVLTISTASLPDASQGVAYNAALAATGGHQPYTWSLTSGGLPAGLALTSSTGSIAGTPTSSGTSTFTVQVTDSQGATASKPLAITVAPQSHRECNIITGPNPLVLVSVDYYTSNIDTGFLPVLVGQALGANTALAISDYPTCVQVGFAAASQERLILAAVSSPIRDGNNFLSSYLWVDTGFPVLGDPDFYPQINFGAFTVFGVDVTNGSVFESTNVTELFVEGLWIF